MTARNDGFYWVMIDRDDGWTLAELLDGDWWVIGTMDRWEAEEFDEIGPYLGTAP